MKTSIIIGFILALIAGGIFYIQDMEVNVELIVGLLFGLGLGLIIGSPAGYFSRKSKVIAAPPKKDISLNE